MDSGNSGSLQSSSGGEDEYDSRGESISSFLNPGGHFGSISGQQPPFMSQQNNFFDPRSNLDAFIQQSSANPNANTQYNNDLVWTRSLRSDQSNYGHFGNLTGSSSRTQNLVNSQGPNSTQQGPGQGQGQFPTAQSVQLTAHAGSEQFDQQPNSAIKNPKKRPRASRRAPTTVLTTDTTNFRQMVQEFTGIPAAPFSGPPYSRRLDLLSTARSGHLGTLGSLYPLRPSTQKVQPSPFLPSSSSPLFNSNMIDAIVSSTNISTANVGSLNSNNFQLPSDLGLIPKQPHNLLNFQNQTLQLQPLLHSPSLKNQLGQAFGTLEMSHDRQVEGNLSGFSNLESTSAGAQGRTEGNIQENIRTFGGNITSEFHSDKVLENVSSAADGTVSSWICPSD
ncbi:uncharacterized protein LOC111408875 [Olea europaea var. sylvestris]|uniref:VQ domain-containing protein n=1 Tax=Olea europaea subsp. europaea TaxID=158383 RepID=A0A8S0SK85_OLEEU|nr:uncharacterized protein LOC111408875 [Olea europaea var. sylvestris]CAA2993090.1 Hypothetical predicted protein [Olea europaea subsp. europaea]